MLSTRLDRAAVLLAVLQAVLAASSLYAAGIAVSKGEADVNHWLNEAWGIVSANEDEMAQLQQITWDRIVGPFAFCLFGSIATIVIAIRGRRMYRTALWWIGFVACCCAAVAVVANAIKMEILLVD